MLAGTWAPPSPPCAVNPPSAPKPGHMQMMVVSEVLESGSASVNDAMSLVEAEQIQAAELLCTVSTGQETFGIQGHKGCAGT